MSLQQTALQEPPESGDEWQVATPEQGTPNALQQQEPPTEETVDPQQQPEAPRYSPMEEVALELGWTPQDRWRGDPNKWTPASEYLRATGRVLERTKNDLRTYKTTAQSLEQRLAALEGDHQTARQREAQSLNAQYEEAKFNAAKAGNEELYGKLAKEQAEVMAQFKPADRPQQQPSQPQVDVHEQAERIMSDPVAARFFEANPIALNDERAWELMDREMTIIAQRGGTPAQQFQAAEAALRYAYSNEYGSPSQPHHSQTQPREQGRFASPTQQQQQPPRRPAPPMAPATRTMTQQPQTAVDRLPAEAKAHLEKEVAAGRIADKEQWARAFHGERITVRGRAPNEPKQGN